MSKKKEIKKIFEDLEPESPESSEASVESTVSKDSGEQQETTSPESTLDSEAEPTTVAAAPTTEPSVEQPEEESPDDLLEDVRKSLIEDEAQDQAEDRPKWWKRIGRSSRKKSAEEPEPQKVEEVNLPGLEVMQEEGTEEVSQDPDEEYLEQIDELIDMLETDDEPVETKPVAAEVESPPEPEKPMDIEELKKQAFQPRQRDGEEENLTEVRSIALEGDEEVFVEVESTRQDPLEERLSAMENALNPYRRSLYLGIAFLGVVMALIAAFVIYNAFQRSQAQSAPTEVVSNLPFPTSVELPGGWNFNLGKGVLEDGNWNPSGAEWLQGTEVCRWVALPYSRQLEAVIRTLNPEDPIELGMSNNDTLVYNVYSIRQMSPQEMQELDTNTPCLLIVLAEPGSEQRWVLTALP